MKKEIVLFLAFLFAISSYAQDHKTLVTINGVKTTVADFKRVYEKNLDAIEGEEARDVTKNLELYINYKLKVAAAYQLQLDTLPAYKREIDSYKNQLSAPYLQDTTFITSLLKKIYFRTKNEVKAKHILIKTPKEATPKDTLIAYNRILEIRNRIVGGEDFEKVAVETSEDPSAKGDLKRGRKANKGNLGYFDAFKMVSPFEDAAYTTKEGAVSMPFRTQFGYHIIKVDNFRLSRGALEVAHILVKDTTALSKTKIDAVYTKLQNKEDFATLVTKYSEDTGSKSRGGKLNKFGTGSMVKPFEDVAFSLVQEGDFSKPFKTMFGWHIVKLLKKYPLRSFEEMKKELTAKIKRSSRMQLSEAAVINTLKTKYTIVENEEAKKILNLKNIRALSKDSLQKSILRINDKNLTQEDFVKYLRNRRHKPVYVLFDMFKNQEILAYYKDNLIHTEPEYAHILEEYEDGLLLFELMQQKIWNKSSKDTLGLKKYFDEHNSVYGNSKLAEVKGAVMNDYQNYLDKNWIADLRRKNTIEISKKQVKKLIKFYNTK